MKILSVIFPAVYCALTSANAALLLGTYDFAAGNSATPDGTYGTYATLGAFNGVNSSAVYTRNTTAGAGAGGSTGYGAVTGFVHPGTDYIGFTLTPVGTVLTLESVSVQLKRNPISGGQALNDLFWGVFSAGTQVSGSGGTLSLSAIGTGWSAAQTLSFNSVSLSSGTTYEVRFWASGGNGNGELDFDNLQVNAGTITAVPEPVNVALALFGCLSGGVFVCRRFSERKAA